MFPPLATAVLCAVAYTPPVCEPGVNMPQGDLPNMPIATADAAACAAACTKTANCSLFSWHSDEHDQSACFNDEKGPSSCSLEGGCCWLKSEEVSGFAPVVNPCVCSGYVRVPPDTFVPSAPAPAGARNVLYILIDDLRPELEPYRQPLAVTPAFAAVAANATVFDNAYCQIAVCSPSRQSFLTGRRPATTGVYNFIDHFRQAECGVPAPDRAFSGDVLRTATIDGCEWGGASPCGASGQCCTLCSAEEGCARWTYTAKQKKCVLHGINASAASVSARGSICGEKGGFDGRASLTTLPEHFRNHGFLTLSTGKIFHTEEGGAANIAPGFEWMNGPGMPPNADMPRSWSAGLSMQKVNDVANMFGCDNNKPIGAPGACAVNASLDGTVANPASEPQLCDRVIADDAVLKLRLAAAHRTATGTPFFLAVGFRKPHLPFRFPAPFLDKFPAEEIIPVAAHPTLPPNVPSLAHHDGAPQASPFTAVANATAQRWRRFYYAAVAWMDSQLARVMDELDKLALADDTLVVMHADHGWSLGEHGNWQKFTNSEHGARVPLIVRAPWIAASRGARTAVLAELIDVFPTMADLIGLPLPVDKFGALDGTSLAPVLHAPADAAVAAVTKARALSQYMRCPKNTSDPSTWWKDNACLMTDRTAFPFMGLSMRTDAYRYTEWYRWNTSTLAPQWGSVVGRELYSHAGDDGSDFDLFENANEVDDKPSVAASLSAELRTAFKEKNSWW